MKYKTIPKTQDKISQLGFGAMRLDHNPKNLQENKEIIKYVIDNGINLIDTAYMYGNGKNEQAIGSALKELNYRDKVKISTKMNRILINNTEDMEKMLNEQLTYLQTDYIDYYFIHNITGYKDIEKLKKLKLYEFLDDKKSQNILKNVGFSYHGSYSDFIKVVDDYDWDMSLVQYNYLDETYQAGIKGIEYLAEKGMGIFIMEPLKGGMLAGRMPQSLEDILEIETNKSKVELALKWILQNENITCILSGMTDTEMLKENINIINDETPLDEKDLEIINRIKEKITELNKVNCTGCNYCMPCPENIYIPECFKLYNEKHLFNEKEYGVNVATIEYVGNLMGITGEKHDASLCTKCGKCIRKCPQHINIPRELNQVNKGFHTRIFAPLIPIFRKLLIRII